MLEQWFGLEAKRKRLLRSAPEGPLRNFLAVPFPDSACPLDKASVLAVDFETTGLDPATDQILSVGFIGMESNEIVLSSAWHQIVKASGDLTEENVVIHQITDDAKLQGDSLESVVSELLNALAGKVMLVHFARIEKTFLQRACKQLYGMAPVFPIIDTFALARKRLDRGQVAFDPSKLRLSNLRDWHGLPHHHAHNALNDALATAELLMAEVALKESKNSLTLKSLLL